MKIGVTPDTATDLLPLIEDADDARQFARQYLGVWMQLPWYQQSWLAAGFSEVDLENGGSDRLIDAIVASGNADAIADHVESYLQAGASRLILQPL